MLKSVAEIEDIMAYVYVVEDDKNISEIESFALKNAGHTVVECASGKEFHKLMRDRIPDMILLDGGGARVSADSAAKDEEDSFEESTEDTQAPAKKETKSKKESKKKGYP